MPNEERIQDERCERRNQKQKERRAKLKAADPNYVKQQTAARKAWSQKNPERQRELERLSRQRCAPQKSERRTRVRAKLLEQGLCVNECGRFATGGRTVCDQCAAKQVAATSRRKTELKALGLCVQCTKRPPIKGKFRCVDCIEWQRRVPTDLNVCNRCRCRPMMVGKRVCQHCQEKLRVTQTEQKQQGLCANHCGRKTDGKVKCSVCSIKAAYRGSFAHFKAHGWAPFAMTLDEFVTWYETTLIKSKGLCAWCGEPFKKKPVVDHDHVTGEVRAIVCTLCNVLEGYGLERIEKVAAVMRSWASQKANQSASTNTSPCQETLTASTVE